MTNKFDLTRDVFGANEALMNEVSRIEKERRLLEQAATVQENAIDYLVATSDRLMRKAWERKL